MHIGSLLVAPGQRRLRKAERLIGPADCTPNLPTNIVPTNIA